MYIIFKESSFLAIKIKTKEKQRFNFALLVGSI